MDVVLIFDVSHNNKEVREALIKSGYRISWITETGKADYYLPQNTVWRKNITFEQAQIDLNKAIVLVNSALPATNQVKLLRYISVISKPWDGINGEQII